MWQQRRSPANHRNIFSSLNWTIEDHLTKKTCEDCWRIPETMKVSTIAIFCTVGLLPVLSLKFHRVKVILSSLVARKCFFSSDLGIDAIIKKLKSSLSENVDCMTRSQMEGSSVKLGDKEGGSNSFPPTLQVGKQSKSIVFEFSCYV